MLSENQDDYCPPPCKRPVPNSNNANEDDQAKETMLLFLQKLRQRHSEKLDASTQTDSSELYIDNVTATVVNNIGDVNGNGNSSSLEFKHVMPAPPLPPLPPHPSSSSVGNCHLHPAYTRQHDGGMLFSSTSTNLPSFTTTSTREQKLPTIPRNTQEMKTLFGKWQQAYVKWFRFMFGCEVTSLDSEDDEDDDDDDDEEDEEEEDEDEEKNSPVDSHKNSVNHQIIIEDCPSLASTTSPAAPQTFSPTISNPPIIYANTGRPLVQVSPAIEFIPLNENHFFPQLENHATTATTGRRCETQSVMVGPNMPWTWRRPTTAVSSSFSSTTPICQDDPYLMLATLAQSTLPQISSYSLASSPSLSPSSCSSASSSSSANLLPIIIRPGMALTNHAFGPKPVMTPWGPLLRYGNYGIHHRNPLDRTTKDGFNITDMAVKAGQKVSQWIPLTEPTKICYDNNPPPPQPPPYIHLPKQTMICKLQVPLQAKRHELERIQHELSAFERYNLNYVNALERVTMSAVSLPVRYFFTCLDRLPISERRWYTDRRPSTDDANVNELSSTNINNMYLCDCLIGDVLIAQTICDWKKRARESAAREAFRVLSKPCFIVGSTRSWYGNEFMVVCLTSDPKIIPQLPPFLSDPTEPLQKKDMGINESIERETFDIVNPMGMDEFWLYTGSSSSSCCCSSQKEYLKENLDKLSDDEVQLWIDRSADFNQMTISYELIVQADANFLVNVLIDKHCAIQVTSTTTIGQARKEGARALLQKLATESGIVGNQSQCDNPWRSLVWGGSQILQSPISLFDLIQQQQANVSVLDEQIMKLLEKLPRDETISLNLLRPVLLAYAESSCIDALSITPQLVSITNWPDVQLLSTQLGLICAQLNDNENCLLLTKRIPLPRLKKSLLTNGHCKDFVLLQKPNNLTEDFVKRYELIQCIDNDDWEGEEKEEEEPKVKEKSEEKILLDKEEQNEEEFCFVDNQHVVPCQFNNNNNQQNSNEILDDLPKELIPGIDF